MAPMNPFPHDRKAHRGLRQIFAAIVDEILRPAEHRHHARECFGSATGAQRVFRPGLALLMRSGDPRGVQHIGRERQRDALQPLVDLPSGQKIDRVFHFHGIARRGGQRLVHIGEQGRCFQPAPFATSTRLVASATASRLRSMKAPLPFHVEHQRLQSGGKLLRQDRSRNQRDGFHSRRNIANAIEAPVGGRARWRSGP
jgi:hypothetical protein